MNYVKAIFTALKATSAKIDWEYFKKVEDWNENVGSALTPVSDISRLTEVSGDGLPDFPDDPSDVICRISYFTAIPPGFGANASPTSTFANGIWTINCDLYTGYFSAPSGSNIFRINIRVLSGSARIGHTDKIIDNREFQWHSFYGTDAGFVIYGNSSPCVIEISDIYLGPGAYLSGLHDKAGRVKWTNYGLLPTDGYRGKGLLALGGQYAVADSPVIGTTFSINRQFKRSSDSILQTLFDNTDSSMHNGARLLITAIDNNLIIRIGGASSYQDVLIKSGVSDTTSRHTCGASLIGTTLKTYYDGVLQNTTTLSVTPTASSNNATLCRESATSQNFAIDYDGIFRSDARVLTDAEFLSWHNDPRSVDSGHPNALSVDWSQTPVYADKATANAAGYYGAFRTSTGMTGWAG